MKDTEQTVATCMRGRHMTKLTLFWPSKRDEMIGNILGNCLVLHRGLIAASLSFISYLLFQLSLCSVVRVPRSILRYAWKPLVLPYSRRSTLLLPCTQLACRCRQAIHTHAHFVGGCAVPLAFASPPHRGCIVAVRAFSHGRSALTSYEPYTQTQGHEHDKDCTRTCISAVMTQHLQQWLAFYPHEKKNPLCLSLVHQGEQYIYVLKFFFNCGTVE